MEKIIPCYCKLGKNILLYNCKDGVAGPAKGACADVRCACAHEADWTNQKLALRGRSGIRRRPRIAAPFGALAANPVMTLEHAHK
jgi:hypothetical protein